MSDALTPSDLPDRKARLRIREDLAHNFLVEAGAGSGKTTALLDRMVALIRTGVCEVGTIAAVTFTRKAAAELRQGFQVELERVLGGLPAEDPGREPLRAALRDLDEAFLGTIHAFCAKLLRERPLEAGLDPGFREVLESEAFRARRRFWVEFLERLAVEGDAELGALERLGVSPDRLRGAFEEIVENPDVDFGFEPVPPPDPEAVRSVRHELESLLDQAQRLLPDQEPAPEWDAFARGVRTLLYWRRSLDWDESGPFFDALAKVVRSKKKLVQKRWADTSAGKAEAKRLWEAFQAFGQGGGPACALLDGWYAHRYPMAMSLAKRAADEFAQERKDRGELNFQDLLVLSAELLRADPFARRDLGKRYRHILVDEFQDTDPLQAEILLLLSSDPGSSKGTGEGLDLQVGVGEDWRDVIPRPGALFVVGDPKQSIYRFRRADVALYEFVKRRFEAFGSVLRLEANFRSLPEIEDMVAGVFQREDRLPPRDTDRQAAYAPLRTQRDDGPGLACSYRIEGRTQDEIARDDAERIASCIARRVHEVGDRAPKDFMILTRNRKHLSVYARALEDRNLPVEVSGAGVGFELELSALLVLLRSLADPEHRVRQLGVLTGPFFGVTLAELVRYRDGGGSFVINEGPAGEGPVQDALRVLHRWWLQAQREPSDVTAERLLREVGLFPLAAGGPLGQLRAGAVVYVLDAIRARALAGDASLDGAVDAVETALAWDDAEAPLVPGGRDAVQVMNLHRAKGLEAPVVFLAAPFGERERTHWKRVARDKEGVARGTMVLRSEDVRGAQVIAKPGSWDEDVREEASFEQAEKVRLLYVATTRARDELWVARGEGLPGNAGGSPWAAVEEWLDESGRAVVDLTPTARSRADRLSTDVDVDDEAAAVQTEVRRRRVPTYHLQTVTARAEGDAAPRDRTPEEGPKVDEFESSGEGPTTGGFEWGSVVHHVLAAAGEGVAGEALEQLARELLIELERPVHPSGEPVELAALLKLVEAVRASSVWARAAESQERFTEMPFAVNRAGEGESGDVLEGVIDLVFRDGDGWVVADYKTDTGDDPAFEDRVPRYRNQVDLYASCWERVTGEEVKERILVFTSQGRIEAW